MPETSETITPEVVSADWSIAKSLFEQIKVNLRLSLAGQVCLGAELERLKKELGFAGRGKKSNSFNVNELKTWPEFLAHEMPELPENTANRFIRIYEGAKSKLKKLGDTKALALFDQPSHQLSDDQREHLRNITDKITDGQSQSSLLQELKIAKLPHGAAAKGGNLPKTTEANDEMQEEDTMRQVALALFTDPTQQLCSIRANSNYEKALHSLPLHSSDETTVTLQALEHHHSSFLADIQKAKAAAEREQSEALEV